LPANFLYVFSPVRAAVDQLDAPVLTAHFYIIIIIIITADDDDDGDEFSALHNAGLKQ